MKTNLKLSIITAAILASTSAIAFDPNLTPHGIGSSDSTLMGGITAGVLAVLPPQPVPPGPDNPWVGTYWPGHSDGGSGPVGDGHSGSIGSDSGGSWGTDFGGDVTGGGVEGSP